MTGDIANYDAEQGIYKINGDLEIVGKSPAMLQLYQFLNILAGKPASVLLTGETGTGKTLIAKALHASGANQTKKNPFVHVNCPAIPEGIMESELFGHVKGAFTGASQARKGHFREADRGTIFLDEVSEMSPDMQAKLLNVLQEREVVPVGATQTASIDVRVLAATNKDLVQEIEKGTFRQDLFHRLNVFPLHVPPLRDRGSDLLDIAAYLVAKNNKKYGTRVTSIDGNAAVILQNYEWGGNVRELENIIERAVLLSDGESLRAQHIIFDQNSLDLTGGQTYRRRRGFRPLVEVMREAELSYIKIALAHTGGRKAEAAKLLGISRKNLWEKLKALEAYEAGLDEEQHDEELEQNDAGEVDEISALSAVRIPATPTEAASLEEKTNTEPEPPKTNPSITLSLNNEVDACYQDGFFPITHVVFHKIKDTKNRKELQRLIEGGLLYAEEFGEKRPIRVYFLTPEILPAVFERHGSSYNELLSEVKANRFVGIDTPFALYNTVRLGTIPGMKTVEALEKVFEQDLIRVIGTHSEQRASKYFIVNKDNARHFVSTNTKRGGFVEDLLADVGQRYEQFQRWRQKMEPDGTLIQHEPTLEEPLSTGRVQAIHYHQGLVLVTAKELREAKGITRGRVDDILKKGEVYKQTIGNQRKRHIFYVTAPDLGQVGNPLELQAWLQTTPVINGEDGPFAVYSIRNIASHEKTYVGSDEIMKRAQETPSLILPVGKHNLIVVNHTNAANFIPGHPGDKQDAVASLMADVKERHDQYQAWVEAR